MIKTNNLNVKSITPVIAPTDLRLVYPLSVEASEFVSVSRTQIKNILKGQDRRLMVVVGPCSIHDPKAAIEYGERLAALSGELSDNCFWQYRKPAPPSAGKIINDPDMNGTHLISKGLGIARGLLCTITGMKLPVATETLDPITPEYMADLLSWGAIGARTTESQTHREIASGLSFPIGFKNGTDGNLQIAIDAMKSALHSHSFLGINREGKTAIIQTAGNPDVHIVLRGSNKKPNYMPEDIKKTEDMLEKSNLFPTIMVDCSHGNSAKDHERQPLVMQEVLDQITAGNRSISGVMIESNLEAGSQNIPAVLSQLKYGVSITDKCIDWKTTEQMLRSAHKQLKACGGRSI
jgi:3-deoxy-7-phosphoheptulonate synthase